MLYVKRKLSSLEFFYLGMRTSFLGYTDKKFEAKNPLPQGKDKGFWLRAITLG